MNRNLGYGALVWILLVPAAASAQSTVTVYGTMYLTAEDVKSSGASSAAEGGTGANVPSLKRLSNHSSSLGFKGTEDLGDGLNAFFQIELGHSPDTGALGGSFRNTGVGLKAASWGTILLGHWDTPIKVSSIRADPWYANTISGYNSIINTPGFNLTQQAYGGGGLAGTVAAFDIRTDNTVQYWTPVVSNFSGRLMVTMPEAQSSTAAGNVKPYFWGLSATYDNGPLWASYAYEKHKDFFGINNMLANGTASYAASPFATVNTATNSSDYSHRASFGYTFGSTTIAAVLERLSYSNQGSTTANALVQYARNAGFVSIKQQVGLGEIRASYGQARSGSCETVAAGCSGADTGAKMFNVGYGYYLSKRTQLVAQYAQLNNERLASYNIGNNPLPRSGVGATLRGVSAGIFHAF